MQEIASSTFSGPGPALEEHPQSEPGGTILIRIKGQIFNTALLSFTPDPEKSGGTIEPSTCSLMAANNTIL
jgi:hypothetical protein